MRRERSSARMISSRRKSCRRHDARNRPHRFVQAFDAAKAAPGGAGEVPPPLAERSGARFGEPHAQLDSGIVLDNVELPDISQPTKCPSSR